VAGGFDFSSVWRRGCWKEVEPTSVFANTYRLGKDPIDFSDLLYDFPVQHIANTTKCQPIAHFLNHNQDFRHRAVARFRP
jgi:hypothetical protein